MTWQVSIAKSLSLKPDETCTIDRRLAKKVTQFALACSPHQEKDSMNDLIPVISRDDRCHIMQKNRGVEFMI